ncbi:Peroxiredoxin [Ignavibacterium album JCM 16511]|uniref:thioredoxin-dependent peroxiredoxin n=1 Tax=Ignavibacterium album (strain DSM 19864 / JCM 16511 / NBRC 101810 / Mat9-16) TaxID=945713 RepID=I0AJN4_IGNAJ|nr:peroxiredoxin [Ignavibacterium album]AFH49191.1 Peroxiredoxin [Ignavibacterium album JCM 16511]
MKNLLVPVGLSVLILISACGGNAENLKVSDTAPDFTLQDSDGNSYTLSSYRGISPVVIYFYPKAGTPGCTKQACGIRDNWTRFSENGIVVLGISVDSKDDIKEFIQENNLNFPLLSDENKEVSKAYGVLNNLGLASRISFVVDKQGKIAEIIRDVDVQKHADQVFEIAMKLK